MNANEPKALDIHADRQAGTLTIKWNNGEEAVLPFDLLRNSCPCAECRGGHANMKSEPDDSMFIIPLMDVKATQLTGIRPVGSYAIALEWADGHSAGIYAWHYLYSLFKQKESKSNS